MSLINREKLLEELNNYYGDIHKDYSVLNIVNETPAVNEESWLIENEKKILAMECKIAELKAALERKAQNLNAIENVATELQAHNNPLREALQEAIGYIPAYTVNESVVSKWRSILAATPAESLQAHDDELIEKVMFIVNQYYDINYIKDDVLRALKGKP